MEKKPRSSSTTNPFILILIILGAIAFGYFYYQQIEVVADIPEAPGGGDRSFVKFKDLQFNFALFKSPAFTKLQTYGNVPVSPGTPGRADVFAPF